MAKRKIKTPPPPSPGAVVTISLPTVLPTVGAGIWGSGLIPAGSQVQIPHTCNTTPAVSMMSRSGLNGEYYRIKVSACELETIQLALSSRNIRYTNLAHDQLSMIDGELARGIIMYYDYKARNNGKDYAGMSLVEFIDTLIPKGEQSG